VAGSPIGRQTGCRSARRCPHSCNARGSPDTSQASRWRGQFPGR